MATMRAVQVRRPGAPLEVVERGVPKPGAGQVRVKVNACGVCHSDVAVVEGQLAGVEYPTYGTAAGWWTRRTDGW